MSAGRTPHGVRGLKFLANAIESNCSRRTPHGVRGLKSVQVDAHALRVVSHPSRGAWIEIDNST